MDNSVEPHTTANIRLPEPFAGWFAARGWQPRPHQLAMYAQVSAGNSALLIAPTGGGKTLAGFLPSLVELSQEGAAGNGLHTLYVSPLKALAVDIARNLEMPVAEMALPIRIESRTGDTPAHKRQRQKTNPPDILITTPEQVSLLMAQEGAEHYFANLKTIILARRWCSSTPARSRSCSFAALWEVNAEALPIALHHGSLGREARQKVEAAMAAGTLRAVVCTSSLDLGIDWGDVDLVIQVGAPKGVKRLVQRIGRANHRFDAPSRAILVPANRLEVLECEAARAAAHDGAQDAEGPAQLKRDVLAQHILGCAVAAPFRPDDLFGEITSAWPYRNLTREDFDQAVDFVSTGGYALKAYERYAKLKPMPDGRLRLAHPRLAQAWRMNAGTIVEAEMLKVRLASRRKSSAGKPLQNWGGKVLGEVEEWFIGQLSVGDTFLFAGQVLRLEAVEELNAYVSRSAAADPMVPSYQGGKFPLSTYLASRVRQMLAEPSSWSDLPQQVRDWLNVQRWKSVLPRAGEMLVETFPRAGKNYLVCYPFDGRLAHQTLGMLLTRRLERAGMKPLGFVCNDYALSVWCLRDMSLAIETGQLSLAQLFDEDMLGDDLDAWLAESMLMKRTFRTCAIIAGLIERRWPGQEKSGRQMTVSADLIYDVLRSHQPDHWLLKAAWDDAASGLIDARRLAQMLARIKGHIIHKPLEAVSPLAVPVMLEIGREPVYGEANDALLAEAARDLESELIDEAMRLV
jgi:ATP-dependent Lhr-like helicase